MLGLMLAVASSRFLCRRFRVFGAGKSNNFFASPRLRWTFALTQVRAAPGGFDCPSGNAQTLV